MDQLRDYFEKNRAAFDHREPPKGAWEKIWKSLGKNSSRSLVMWRAAAIFFFAMSAYLFLSTDPILKSRELTKLQGEFMDLENFYSDQIAEKVSLIQDFDNAYEDDQFSQDIQKLDAMYQVLREEMKTKPTEKVKDALILNMIVRIDLLNQQIKRLEDDRKKEKAGDSEV
jgi:hypothetical protein